MRYLIFQVSSENRAAAHPYEEVAGALRDAILAGRLTAGARVPSEWDLAAEHATSRPTVRRAIALLKSEGLVVTEQGRGTFVRPHPRVRLRVVGGNFRRHRAEGRSGFNAQVAEQGMRPDQQLLEVGFVPAPDDVAARLGVSPSAAVLVRRRLFLVDHQPVSTCDSYYRAELARGTRLEEPRRIAGGAYAAIEDPNGPIHRQVARSVDEVASRMPTRQEAAVLNLSRGVPIIRIVRTVFDADDDPVEVQDTIASAESNELRYEVSMK